MTPAPSGRGALSGVGFLEFLQINVRGRDMIDMKNDGIKRHEQVCRFQRSLNMVGG